MSEVIFYPPKGTFYLPKGTFSLPKGTFYLQKGTVYLPKDKFYKICTILENPGKSWNWEENFQALESP